MPIACPLAIRSLSYQDFKQLDYQVVMPQAFATHNCLGPLADEVIYKADLVARLRGSEFSVHREVPIIACFRNFEKRYSIDMLVSDCGVYEIKTARSLTQEHEMQLLNYLFLLDIERGKLINFRTDRVESRFINSGTSRDQRQNFSVTDDRWKDESPLQTICTSILRDWGTGLSLSLYYQALTHFLGGEERVVKQVPMNRDGMPLGRQRFHLIDRRSPFQVTALSGPLPQYEKSLRKLLHHSPFEAIHWINISLSEVQFATVT